MEKLSGMRKPEPWIRSLANLKLKRQEANRREPIAEMWQSTILQRKGPSLPTNQPGHRWPQASLLELQFTRMSWRNKARKRAKNPFRSNEVTGVPFPCAKPAVTGQRCRLEPTSPTLSPSAKWGCYFSCFKQLIMIVWKSGLETLDPFNNI